MAARTKLDAATRAKKMHVQARRSGAARNNTSRRVRATIVESEIQVGGRPVYIEVTEVTLPRQAAAAFAVAAFRPEELINRLGAAGEVAGAACLRLFDRMNETLKGGVHPEEVSIEFGISLGGEVGVPFVAKGKGEATFKVSAKWNLGT